MKKNIHSKCFNVNFSCSCGNKFKLFIALKSEKINIDVCNECHPFYTGKQKLIDVAGRIDSFYKKFGNFKK